MKTFNSGACPIRIAGWIIGFASIVAACKNETPVQSFDVYKVNIVCPDPKRTFDSLKLAYDLPVLWEYQEMNGFASGALALANAAIEVKTYFDSSVVRPTAMEIALITDQPDTTTYHTLLDLDINVNKPVRREGWFFSAVTVPDFKIMPDHGSGIYVTHYDDYLQFIQHRDSVRRHTTKSMKSITVHSPYAGKLGETWSKLAIGKGNPVVSFVEDSTASIAFSIQ